MGASSESVTFRYLLERVARLCMRGDPGAGAAEKLTATRGMSILAVHLAAMPTPFGLAREHTDKHRAFAAQVP